MSGMVILDNCITYTFMCRDKRFFLDMSAERLEGEGRHADVFCEFKHNLHDLDMSCDSEDGVADPNDTQLRTLCESTYAQRGNAHNSARLLRRRDLCFRPGKLQ